jgi:hypothetical protein
MNFFTAEVVNNAADPAQAGSVSIRIQGSQDKLSNDQLRLAKPMFNGTNPMQNKVGGPAVGLLNGSQIVGFFLDGESGQIPVIMGSIGSEGKRQEKNAPIEYPKGDTPVATKEKQNKEGKQLGGGDYRFIPDDDRSKSSDKLDNKPIRDYANTEAPNPYGETTIGYTVDDGKASFSCGQCDPAWA